MRVLLVLREWTSASLMAGGACPSDDLRLGAHVFWKAADQLPPSSDVRAADSPTPPRPLRHARSSPHALVSCQPRAGTSPPTRAAPLAAAGPLLQAGAAARFCTVYGVWRCAPLLLDPQQVPCPKEGARREACWGHPMRSIQSIGCHLCSFSWRVQPRNCGHQCRLARCPCGYFNALLQC
jgi:hypothetical protein